jgi:uncharacterized membrane protein YbhN (UPF0104 family)
MGRALDAMRLRRLVRAVVIAAMAWSIALIALALAWGGEEFMARVGAIGPELAGATLAAFALNHALRFVRWQLMLRSEGYRVPWPRSLSIFLAGLALLPTPAKAGVAARSLLLVREGVPVHVSLAAYFVERLLDLVGLVVIASLVLASGAPATRFALALAIAVAGVVAVAIAPRACRALQPRLGGRPALARVVDWLVTFFADAAHMLSGWRLPAFVALGLAANLVTGALLWFVLAGSATPLAFSTAAGILGVSHLSGSASLLPGGMGGFELAMLGQLALLHIPAGQALVALALVRLTTLWGSVLVGLPLLYAGLRRSASLEPA